MSCTPPIINLAGERFGRLVVLSLHPGKQGRNCLWLCRCDCGEERVVRSGNLRSGHSTSCGCLARMAFAAANAARRAARQKRINHYPTAG